MDYKRKSEDDHCNGSNTKKIKPCDVVDDEHNEPLNEHSGPHDEQNEPHEDGRSRKINKKFAYKAQKFVDAMENIYSWNCDPDIDIAYYWDDDFVDPAEYRVVSSTCTRKYKRTIHANGRGMVIVKKRKIKDHISAYMYRSNNSLNSDDAEHYELHEDESDAGIKDNFAQKTQKFVDAMAKIYSWNCDPDNDITYSWDDDFVDPAEYAMSTQ